MGGVIYPNFFEIFEEKKKLCKAPYSVLVLLIHPLPSFPRLAQPAGGVKNNYTNYTCGIMTCDELNLIKTEILTTQHNIEDTKQIVE